MEGVLTPEIWIAFADATGIPELRRTTRDEPDYDRLMRMRLDILRKRNLRLPDIQKVIAGLGPLDGARAFLDRLRREHEVVILSDTFYQFAAPLIEQLNFPTLFCNELIVGTEGRIDDYRLRQSDGKRHAVLAFKQLNFKVLAAGDSYNDTTMLCEAHRGVLFRCPDSVAEQFPQLARTETYDELYQALVRP
jgi:phosphoserine/homoserine phosphotransferase